jgi:hypothetical protein
VDLVAGRAFGVSGKSVDNAETILKRGAPDLVARVERGEDSINQGRQIAQFPKGAVASCWRVVILMCGQNE